MSERSIAEVIAQYNEAFRLHDPQLLVGLIAEDCVIEDTTPAPDGARHVGGAACLARWTGLAGDHGLTFTPEDVEIVGDRAVIPWQLTWGPGPADRVRGVNLMRLRAGRIIEALGYVKS